MADHSPTDAQVRAALERIVAAQEMRRSPQLAHFLTYVIEQKLAGKGDAIKAYAVAVDVFGRDAGFDPQRDPIVRVQARRLRTALEHYYAEEQDPGPVRIRLPLGGYVPVFEFANLASPVAAAEGSGSAPELAPDSTLPAPHSYPRRRRRKSQWRFVVLSAVVALLIGLPVAIQFFPPRITAPQPPARAEAAMPPPPVVRVVPFSNLTGSPAFEQAMSALAANLVAALGGFDDVVVQPSDSVDERSLLLSGSVKRVAAGLQINAILSAKDGAEIVWSTTVVKPWQVSQLSASMSEAAETITTQLTPFSGPLHAAGRAWLQSQTVQPEAPNLYVCMLQHGLAHQTGQSADEARALNCYERLLAQEPDSVLALAAWGGLDAEMVLDQAKPGEDLRPALAAALASCGQAARLAPQRSFVREQLARVLDAEGANMVAAAEFVVALGLNPSNPDAQAAYGRALVLSGKWDEGLAQARQAIAAAPLPPPWYNLAPALGAFAEGDVKHAIDSAQALAPGDIEFGPAVALAAGFAAGRDDIVKYYWPLVMSNKAFREVGILPRLKLRLRDPAVLQKLGAGLAAAGVPQQALQGPF